MNTHLPYCKKGDWFCKNCANKKGWNVGIEGYDYAVCEDKNKEALFEDSDADDFASDSKRLKRLKKGKR